MVDCSDHALVPERKDTELLHCGPGFYLTLGFTSIWHFFIYFAATDFVRHQPNGLTTYLFDDTHLKRAMCVTPVFPNKTMKQISWMSGIMVVLGLLLLLLLPPSAPYLVRPNGTLRAKSPD